MVLSQLLQHVVISILLVVDVGIVALCRLHIHHVISDQPLHLQWVEILLVDEHVSEGALHVLNLVKLDVQDVIELFEVLFHVIDGDTGGQLVLNRFEFPNELCLHVANLGFAAFEASGVLLHPVLAVVD